MYHTVCHPVSRSTVKSNWQFKYDTVFRLMTDQSGLSYFCIFIIFYALVYDYYTVVHRKVPLLFLL